MTTIVAAFDALVNVCTVALPNARVDDGPTVSPYERDAEGWTTGVSVGWDADGPAVEVALDRDQSDGMGADTETYTIYSTLFKSNGDAETRPLRVSAFADYVAIKKELRSRRPLAPGVLWARMSVVDYEVRPVEGGWDGRLRFSVEISAFDRE